jgi:hypothetical protein
MRSVPFQEVVYAVASKIGLDPRRDLQSNQMKAAVIFINLWVRRLWDKVDWNEWTTVEERTPVDHVVYYEQDNKTPLGRVLKVFLNDPLSTNAPVDIPFRLTDQGVHCGYEHGATVWIKFIQREPQFTSDLWNPARTYNAGELAYLAETGECYSSIGNNNRGNYPGPVGRRIPIPTEQTQSSTQDSPGVPAVNKIIDIDFSGLTPDASGTVNFASVYADTPPVTPVGSDTYNGASNATASDIRDGLLAALQGDGSLSAYTFTSLDDPVRIRVEGASDFSIYPTPYSQSNAMSMRDFLKVSQVQAYSAGASGTAGQDQFVKVTYNDTLVVPGEIYSLTFVDLSGVSHTASYTSLSTDTLPLILAGIAAAVSGSSDTFFSGIGISIVDSTLVISTKGNVTVDATMERGPVPPEPIPNPPVPVPPTFWFYVPFPHDLALQVIQGAYADYLKMEGQTDKGMAEEKSALDQQVETVGAKIAPPYPALTDQQQPAQRFRGTG